MCDMVFDTCQSKFPDRLVIDGKVFSAESVERIILQVRGITSLAYMRINGKTTLYLSTAKD